jgi:hypothetical protein
MAQAFDVADTSTEEGNPSFARRGKGWLMLLPPRGLAVKGGINLHE